jgi:hypothetical protein
MPKQFNAGRRTFTTDVLKQRHIHWQEMSLNLSLTPYTKIVDHGVKSKWIADNGLQTYHELKMFISLLRKNIGEKSLGPRSR